MPLTWDGDKVNKTGWRPGPWMNEPDRAAWLLDGTPCLALRGPLGAWCGYIGLAPDHPMHGKSYDDVRMSDDEPPNVHGGLTYAEAPQEQPGEIRNNDFPDHWWIGFDCAHSGDYTEMQYGDESSFARSMAAAGYPLTDPAPFDAEWPSNVYRTLDYVKHEVESLARALTPRVGS